MNDQDIISLKNINKISSRQVMRMKENMNDLKKTNKQKKKTGVKSPKQNNCIANQTIYRPIGA